MDLSIAASLCMTFEGFRPKPYLCPADVPTIGYGSTFYADGRRVTLQDAPITRAVARALMMHELERVCVPAVKRCCPSLEKHLSKFNAIADFVFNLGAGRLQTSTLRRKLNEEDWDGAKEQLMRWVYGGGRKLPGLVARRTAECALF